MLVLALSINQEGFIRYSSILEGNAADPATLPDMIKTITEKARVPQNDNTLVVIDAGIASEKNLQLIKENGYHYLCVSKKHLTDYSYSDETRVVTVLDSKKQEIKLREVKHEDGDYYLEITSPMKEVKERSINRQFKQRFEEMLTSAKQALSKPRGKKNYEKVIERVGRAIAKYPSIAKWYTFTYKRSESNPKNMADFSWEIKDPSQIDKYSGVYFLITDIPEIGEKQTWNFYNLIRDIEAKPPTKIRLKSSSNISSNR